MSKTMKIVGIAMVSILVVGIVIIGGYKIMQKVEHNEMVKVVKSEEAKQEYKELLKNLDSQAFTKNGVIQSYEIDDKSVEHNPMGGIFVTLYINNDKDLNVTYNLNKDINTGEYLSGSSSVSEKLAKLLKEKSK